MASGRDHWREDAACKGKAGTIFYPDHRIMNDSRWDVPRTICADCSVKTQCLAMVLKFEDTDDRWGMFGGLTPAERREVRYQKRHR